LLISQGANINARGHSDTTIGHELVDMLSSSTTEQKIKILKMLQENHYDFSQQNSSGQNILHSAVEHGDAVVLEFLLKDLKLSNLLQVRDNSGDLPQNTVIKILRNETDSIKVLDVLVRYGIDINATNRGGNTLLQQAAEENQLFMVEAL
jgi:ankyrin repeat protein